MDFDEIPSVKLREDIHHIQRQGGAVPNITLSQANISYSSSRGADGEEDDKLIKKIKTPEKLPNKNLKAYAG